MYKKTFYLLLITILLFFSGCSSTTTGTKTEDALIGTWYDEYLGGSTSLVIEFKEDGTADSAAAFGVYGTSDWEALTETSTYSVNNNIISFEYLDGTDIGYFEGDYTYELKDEDSKEVLYLYYTYEDEVDTEPTYTLVKTNNLTLSQAIDKYTLNPDWITEEGHSSDNTSTNDTLTSIDYQNGRYTLDELLYSPEPHVWIARTGDYNPDKPNNIIGEKSYLFIIENGNVTYYSSSNISTTSSQFYRDYSPEELLTAIENGDIEAVNNNYMTTPHTAYLETTDNANGSETITITDGNSTLFSATFTNDDQSRLDGKDMDMLGFKAIGTSSNDKGYYSYHGFFMSCPADTLMKIYIEN